MTGTSTFANLTLALSQLLAALATIEGASGQPTITSITNGSSAIPPGFPNYGITPSSLVAITGTGLASGTDPAELISAIGAGLPTTWNGASVAITINGTTVNPAFYRAYNQQLALVLPSNTPVGTGTLTVNYNGATATANITVVANAPGLTYYGANLVVATDPAASQTRVFSYTDAAQPGQMITFWGTGLGADPADSDTVYTPTPSAIDAPLQVYIGGIQASISYQGSSGYPGIQIINVIVPPNVQPGCAVSVVAVSGNFVSNFPVLPIAAGGGACSDANTGITGTQLANAGGQTAVRIGAVGVLQSTSSAQTSALAFGVFGGIAGSDFSTSTGSDVSIGSCIVSQTVASSAESTAVIPLDPGNVIVSGPGGTLPLAELSIGNLEAQWLSAIPSTGATFVFTGMGGNDVGAFTASFMFLTPSVSWTNQSAASIVTRSQGLLVTWSGGAPQTYVTISGSSASSGLLGSYTCVAPASAGQFTVPAYVLLALPAGSGSTVVMNSTNYQPFQATGLDFGYVYGGSMFSTTSNYN